MFNPKRVIFEKGALDTEVGQNVYNKVKDNPKIEIINDAASNRIKLHIPGENLHDQYRSGKIIIQKSGSVSIHNKNFSYLLYINFGHLIYPSP
ncbi:MAG: hypothetical protein SPJ62_12950 [Inconstantimicrobium porci]|uniref:hypothetical protein n=1 Tax=Inconstantimicrobium porci TaxID=2652291 RepID=UPI0024090C90|nr:hypothetical protein [Inconstantimicrobium porci]MDD6769337.1 hypothetical protein [Inconstantimicrobium porci]MDY5912879.1 hypothetical protein [Inconstantimicrobium porci]